MKDVIILFGEMGSGKNYWGEQLARELNYTFYDGDLVATQEVIERVTRFEMLDRELVLQLVNRLCDAVMEMVPETNGLVVAQALYFDEDRRYIERRLTEQGYNVSFRWIRTPFWRNLKQIYTRPDGLRWVIYWLQNKSWFQEPTHDYIPIR